MQGNQSKLLTVKMASMKPVRTVGLTSERGNSRHHPCNQCCRHQILPVPPSPSPSRVTCSQIARPLQSHKWIMKRLLSQLFYCPDICSLKTYTESPMTRSRVDWAAAATSAATAAVPAKASQPSGNPCPCSCPASDDCREIFDVVLCTTRRGECTFSRGMLVSWGSL